MCNFKRFFLFLQNGGDWITSIVAENLSGLFIYIDYSNYDAIISIHLKVTLKKCR